jgi:hypothetical protein
VIITALVVEQEGQERERERDGEREGGQAYVELQHGDVDVVEQLGVILDRVARGKEHDHLLLHVLLQEGEEQKEPHVAGHDDVALKADERTHGQR